MNPNRQNQLIIVTTTDILFVHLSTLQQNHQLSLNVTESQTIRQVLLCTATNKLYGITDRLVFELRPDYPTENAYKCLFDAVVLKEERAVHNDHDPIRCVDISADGSIMCICWTNGILILRQTIQQSPPQWQAQQFVQVADKHLQCAFIRFDGAPVPVLAITTLTNLLVVDLQPIMLSTNILKFARAPRAVNISPDGELMTVITASGACRVYNAARIAQQLADRQKIEQQRCDRHSAVNLRSTLDRILSRSRLELHLAEFHRYPCEHRSIIWQQLLRVPRNVPAFASLRKLGEHSCIAHFSRMYPLQDATAAHDVTAIVSALVHWCPALAALESLPHFVFPFRRLFAPDILATFETIATLLLNHGQMWLELSAAMPLFSYLAMCDKLLAHFQPQLHRFYAHHAIPTAVYIGWPLETGFAEVLNESQWLVLWDHVCTRPAWWLPFVVVALQAQLRDVIRRLPGRPECERFFREFVGEQMDIGRIALRADELAVTCPVNLHPRQFLRADESLASSDDADDGYRLFTNYPRFVDRLRIEQCATAVENDKTKRFVNGKLFEMEGLKRSLEQLVLGGERNEEHERWLTKAEAVYAATVEQLEMKDNFLI